MEEYKYAPLVPRITFQTGSQEPVEPLSDFSKNEAPIRIFTLHPGYHEDSLNGELSIRGSINEKYEALSYYWGLEKTPQQFVRIIGEDRSVRRLDITPNLASALIHLRHEHKSRRLWIDAICINQKDKSEQSTQIPWMDRIYGQASNVCVWLGDKSESSERALDLIDRMLDLKDFDGLVHDEHTAKWASLSELMRRDWFSRRWVVQEIAYARKATVHCGKQSIDWSSLADAVALFGSRARDIAQLFRKDPKYNHRADYLGDVTALGANRLVSTVSKLFRKSDDGQKYERLLSLESVVSHLSAFKASKPHDIIYAVLSLASDTITSAKSSSMRRRGSINAETIRTAKDKTEALAMQFIRGVQDGVENKTFHVDYEKKKFYAVCKDFIDFTIKSSKSLDMLCRPWAPDKEDLPPQDKEDLPSWICRLSNSPFRQRPDGNYSRVNADLLVGIPDLGRRSYRASANTSPRFSFKRSSDPDSRSLFVEGFKLATISVLKVPAIEGNVPYEWLDFGGWHDTTKDPPESFWRTLVGDRDFEGRNPPSYYRRACQYAFAQRVAGGSLNTEKLMTNESSTIMADYLQRVQAVVWMRRLMTMERTGRLSGFAQITRKRETSFASLKAVVYLSCFAS